MKRVVALALGVALIAALPARALAGPVEAGLLARIAATLATIEETLRRTNEVVSATKERLAAVYPPDVVRSIEHAFVSVRSIEEEVKALACDWKFSPRVQRLWEGVFSGRRICREEWVALFGSAPPYVLQDLDEYFDYQSTRRINMVATRVERGQAQKDFLEWLLGEAKRGRNPDGTGPASPGYSQRLSAIGAAALGNVLLEEGDTQTAELELRQERASEARYRKRLETELSIDLYSQLAGEGGAPEKAP
jgi:hypothetical protein